MFQKIKEKIKEKKLVIFGEVHGTKEIPHLILNFLKEFEEDFDLCLEVPEEFQKEIDIFMEGGAIPSFYKEKPLDGRNSFEYLDLIKNISQINKNKKNKIKIFCVDTFSKNQKEKEEKLAKNILKNLKEKKLFGILGEIHASKNKIIFGENEILPVGHILSKKINNEFFTVRVKPQKGNYFNFGIKEIEDMNDSFDENFDYVLNLEKVSACSFQNN